MPTYNPERSPELYPARWHEVARAGIGQYLVTIVNTDAEAKRVARRFESFRASLRLYAKHPTSVALGSRTIRLSNKRTHNGIEIWATVGLSPAAMAAITTKLFQGD